MPMRAAFRKLGWEPFVYLTYLGMLVFQPIFDPASTLWDWLAVLGLIAVFLPIYFWTYLTAPRQRLWGVAAMALLGVFSLQFVNSGGGVFLVYAAAATPYATSRPRTLYVLASILALAFLAFLVSPIPFPYRWAVFAAAFVFVPFIGGVQMFQVERERANARLRLAQDEIERLATIAERERIARDLHDLLGHTLSSITLKADLAHKLASRDAARAAQEMLEVAHISRGALAEVRAAVSGYRARGLTGEVAAAKLICEAAGVSFSFRGEPAALSAVQEGALSLVLREAVTNTVRHARATRCHAELTETPDGVLLEIHDDGRGARGAPEGNGLANIRERVALLGGRLELASVPGFSLRVRLPSARLVPQPARTAPQHA